MDNQNKQVAPPTPDVKIHALVRDQNGKPKIDGDPMDLHPSILAAMTQDEIKTAQKEYVK